MEEFVYLFEELYGQNRMTFNIHALGYCIQLLEECGPLSLNSAYGFKSQIYQLKGFVNGPRGMNKQMWREFLQTFVLKSDNIQDQLKTSEKAAAYCKKVFSPKKSLTFVEKTGEVTFCGKSSITKISDAVYKSFLKCIYNGTEYHSVK